MGVRINREAFQRLRTVADALRISPGDVRGPILVRLGQKHREQMKRNFATEGATTKGGKWAPLNERYAKRKRRAFPRQRMLQLSGEMKRRFSERQDQHYIQEVVEATDSRWRFRFGAYDDVAAAHFHGEPDRAAPRVLATRRAAASSRVFGGRAPRLPKRDMVTKSDEQVRELRRVVVIWYNKERVPQVLRAMGRFPGPR
jgi:hypothetical protein